MTTIHISSLLHTQALTSPKRVITKQTFLRDLLSFKKSNCNEVSACHDMPLPALAPVVPFSSKAEVASHAPNSLHSSYSLRRRRGRRYYGLIKPGLLLYASEANRAIGKSHTSSGHNQCIPVLNINFKFLHLSSLSLYSTKLLA